jgi:hypothetical protein
MKIYISNYRNHWISPYTIIEYIFFWTDWSKCGRNKGVIADEDYVDHPKWVERWAKRVEPISTAIRVVLDFIHPRINYVKIDRWDTWSMDHTLAHIILPMLKQLDKEKHGAPYTNDEDVPEYLRSHMAQPKENEWDTDSLHFMRWDWILAEMIWAFQQEIRDDDEADFYDYSAYEKDNGKTNFDQFFKDISDGVKRTKVDDEGLKAHQKRKANGFRLFGKYYQNLWD